jgi:hypothetical protein
MLKNFKDLVKQVKREDRNKKFIVRAQTDNGYFHRQFYTRGADALKCADRKAAEMIKERCGGFVIVSAPYRQEPPILKKVTISVD